MTRPKHEVAEIIRTHGQDFVKQYPQSAHHLRTLQALSQCRTASLGELYIKQNTLLGKSPTKMEITQANHIFASMIAFVKLEHLKIKERSNHFALKARLYIKMVQAALEELKKLREQMPANT